MCNQAITSNEYEGAVGYNFATIALAITYHSSEGTWFDINFVPAYIFHWQSSLSFNYQIRDPLPRVYRDEMLL